MMLWSVCPAGLGRPGQTAEFGVRGEGSLNLDASLPHRGKKSIKNLETWGELFVNTPNTQRLLFC